MLRENMRTLPGIKSMRSFFRAGLEFTWTLLKVLRLSEPTKQFLLPVIIERLDGTVLTSQVEFTQNCRRNLKKIAEDSKPIIVGPWLSEVGFELLYWIPFLNWAIAEYSLSKERIAVISRGGAAPWYRDIYGQYLDIFDYFPAEEFKAKNQRRIQKSGGQKHNLISDFDQEIVDLVGKKLKIDEFNWLHPSLMYILFEHYWRRKCPISLIENHTIYRQLGPFQPEIPLPLPDDYVAVKFYFSKCFPDTEENRLFILKTLKTLAGKTHVVVLNTGLDIDDHRESLVQNSERIHTVQHLMTPNNNLTVQTQVISKARLFLGTYGGFSYLAPFYGVPSVALYSREDKFLLVHLDVAYRAVRALKYGEFDKVNKAKDNYNFEGRPEFMAFNIRNFDLLKILF
jgi:hypothetical protein